MRKVKIYSLIFFILFLFSFSLLFFAEVPLFNSFSSAKVTSFVFPPDLLVKDTWYGIYFGDKYIGYSHSFMQAEGLDKGGGFIITNRTILNLPILDMIKNVALSSKMKLDKAYLLEEAYFKLVSSDYTLSSVLKRKEKDTFMLTLITPAQKIEKEVKIKDELVNFSMSPLLFNYLPSQEEMHFDFFDPLLNKKTKLKLTRKGITSFTFKGKSYIVREFELDMEGIKGKLYTDKKGSMIMQEMLGFKIVKEDSSLLFKEQNFLTNFDVVKDLSVKVNIPISKKNISYLKVKVEGIDGNLLIDDFNQKVDKLEGIVEVYKKVPSYEDYFWDGEKFNEYLREDSFIRFKGTEIEEKAKDIIGDEKNPMQKVKLIYDWINKNIKKVPTLSVPNSLDTFKLKQGDCGELTALMVGFLRSLGIPSYVNIGLAYANGKFFYHAWPSVYIGEWFDIDPALEEFVANAGHIKLIKGFDNQTYILRFINSIKIEVLDFK